MASHSHKAKIRVSTSDRKITRLLQDPVGILPEHLMIRLVTFYLYRGVTDPGAGLLERSPNERLILDREILPVPGIVLRGMYVRCQYLSTVRAG